MTGIVLYMTEIFLNMTAFADNYNADELNGMPGLVTNLDRILSFKLLI